MNLRIIFAAIFITLSTVFNLTAQDEPPLLSGIKGNFFILNEGRDSMEFAGLKDSQSQLIFCLFHAEEDPIGLDPGLSTDGRWRALNLLKILKNIEFKAFFTTPFRNNILTLQPLTDFKRTQPVYYDQADLKSLFNQIDNVNPGNLVMMIHHATFPTIFKNFMGEDLLEDISLEPANRIFIIYREPKSKPTFFTFRYNIR
ncbi:MAG: hypothetical protein IPG87_16570 [Saprospiraceae bacterium]|nr:hypothetical protein [Candidatus Vicinibacter affinis]MBK7696087.1 hypothetical protein [Candidatus Vicinibacter affinis]MBK8642111.1 hypothetical protein [Candidatus Vicinibacter affinis]